MCLRRNRLVNRNFSMLETKKKHIRNLQRLQQRVYFFFGMIFRLIKSFENTTDYKNKTLAWYSSLMNQFKFSSLQILFSQCIGSNLAGIVH